MPGRLALLFAAGCLGGLLNSLAVWGSAQAGINSALGVAIAPHLSPAWLYPRIVWGGLWGLLFLLPWRRHSWLLRGLVFSLGPTLVQLFFVFPYQSGKGLGGLDLGMLTPLLVLVFNAVLGVTTAIWLRLSRRY